MRYISTWNFLAELILAGVHTDNERDKGAFMRVDF